MTDPRLELGNTYCPDWIPLAGERGGFFPVGQLPFVIFRFSDAPDEQMRAFLKQLGAVHRPIKPLGAWIAVIDSLPDDPKSSDSEVGTYNDDSDVVKQDDQLPADGADNAVASDHLAPDRETIADPEVLAVHLTATIFERTSGDVPFTQPQLNRQRINQIICDLYDAVRSEVTTNSWTCIGEALESANIQAIRTGLLQTLIEFAAIRPEGQLSKFWQRLRLAWSDIA